MSKLYSNFTFVRLFLGRLITNAGDSMYTIAATWLVWDLTGSSFYTGIAGFLMFSAQPLQFLVGPLVDRWSLRRVLVGTQAIQGAGVLIVPLAAVTGHLSVWVVLFIIPILGFLNQFVYPAQNAALPRIVDDEKLVRANSLFSFAYQGVDLAFNAITGVLITVMSAVAIYVLDAITFGIALLLFIGISIPKDENVTDKEAENNPGSTDYLNNLREGFGYIRGSIVFDIILGTIVVNFSFGMMTAVLPAFADLLGSSDVYGFLMAAIAGGMLIGATGASLLEEYPVGWIQVVGFSLTSVFWTLAVIVPGLWPTIALFFTAFLPAGAINVISSSMLQSAVDDTLLGRVMSVRTSASTLMMPVGSLLGGVAASHLGIKMVLLGMAVASALLAFYFLVRPQLRTLPPVADTNEKILGLGSQNRTNE